MLISRSMIFCAALLASVSFIGNVNAQSPASADTQVEIKTVIDEIETALAKVATDLDKHNLPPLKQVSLTLQTVVTGKAGGTIKLLIFTFGSTYKKSTAQQIDLILEPPPANAAINVGTGDVAAALEAAIESAVNGAAGDSTAPVPLKTTGLTVSLSFTVEKTGNAGVKPQIVLLSPDVSVDTDKTAVNTIKIQFGDFTPKQATPAKS